MELGRPLWFKSESLDHATAEAYLDQKLRNFYLAQAAQPTVDFDEAPVVFHNSVRYLEILEPNSVLYTGDANEPGFNVWVRGCGGHDKAPAGRNRYAEFDSGGAQLGFDIPLGRTSRIGLFGTYAVMDGSNGSRGSWNADGWGGGGYAEYWSDTLYLRGMLSAGGYDGEHRRSVNGETARGDRSGNSLTGVIGVGAPFDSGDWIIEPQAQLSYTNTSLDKFSETSGDNQKVTLLESGNSYSTSINSDVDHGALVELGLDYTTYNFTDTSMGVYARGGAVFWGGDLGTSWRVSGGLTFRF